MKKEEMFKVLGKIDEKSIGEAGEYKKVRRPAYLRWVAAAACLVLLAGAALGISGIFRKKDTAISEETLGLTMYLADYPEKAGEGMSGEAFMEGEGHYDWWKKYIEKIQKSEHLQSDLQGFYQKMMEKLVASDDENTVCSPINTYIAFSMLAEVTDGNTRQQILDVLDAPDIGTLRKNVALLWNGNYADTPVLKSVLANSIWMREGLKYNEKTLKTLCENYYASSFIGDTGSKEMAEALRKWIDDNTGGLLTEYTKDIGMDPDTVMEIVSTLYFKAGWTEPFYGKFTDEETFHGSKGDTTVNMMHKTCMTGVYKSSKFTAVGIPLTDSGEMHFILPKEDVDVSELVSDPEIFKSMSFDNEDEKWSAPIVHLSLPRFRVSKKYDLKDTMKELGLTEVFAPDRSDFTPLTADTENLYVSKADHAAMIEIDEKGVTGAAYTDIAVAEGAADPDDEIDLVFDRPFMFIVTGKDGSILFSGIVRNID